MRDITNDFDDEIIEDRKPPERRVVSAGDESGIKISKWLLVVPAVGAMVVSWFVFARFYTDYLWFSSVGFAGVFSTIWTTTVIVGLIVGSGVSVLTWLNLRSAAGFAGPPRLLQMEGATAALPILKRAPILLAVFAGLFMGLTAVGSWEMILRFLYQVPFSTVDPLFGRDVAFYVFTLPALEWISSLLLLLVFFNLFATGLMYLASSNFKFDRQKQKFSDFEFPRSGRNHLFGLAAAVFLIVAAKTYLTIAHLPIILEAGFFGANYADVNATLPLLWAQIVAAVVAALLTVTCVFRRNNRLFFAGTVLLILVAVAGSIYPSLVQRFSVAPNELAKETPYIKNNIDATRTAFGLNNVEERELSGAMALTAADIKENRRTIDNVRLWDQQPLLDTFGQIQEIRTYYEFKSVDNDRYRINGEMQQVMISPRELNAESLPNRNWINEHLTFTHGYGATVGPVNKVTSEGLPELYVKNLPPETSVPELKIERPEIYFGEMSNDRVYVNTKTDEFNYPAGEENVFRNHSGANGMPLGSLFDQMLFASSFSDLKLLLSQDFTPDTKVLAVRNINDRLKKVAPYLRFDSDPYMVINEGKLVWIADAYTTTNRYPYSQPTDGINYIRNAVKATVDAYDGTVNLYVADESDPIIQTYARIFPNTLRPLAEMPESLRAHLRYPEDQFNLQARVFATYQMNEPQEFYNKEDQWTIAQIPGGSEKEESKTMEPYYTIMKLPNEQKEEFILMLPFTPQRKDNLAAWMVARSDGENYGKLAAYRFPKQQLVFGPKQIVARINQDPEIARQLTLWNQRGSRVIFGTLMVIPIKESLVYVQPLYLRADTGKIPELRRVIVASDNRIAMEETLDKSLDRLFGETSAKPPGGEKQVVLNQPAPGPVDANGLIEQAKQQYQQALEAQRAGDWAKYGEEVKRLGETLEKLGEKK